MTSGQVGGTEQIRRRAADYAATPFLLTVTDDGEPHCSPTPVQWAGDEVIVPAPRHWSSRAQSASTADEPSPARSVSLLYPPADADGYALIVNGTTRDRGPRLRVTITRAVLHRRGRPATPDPASSCGSDCVPLYPQR